MLPDVLVTAGSRRVALVQAFQRAVRQSGRGSVIVTDVNPLSPTVYVADRSYPVPLSTSPDYLDEILRICSIERVGLVVPTIDDELEVFAAGADRFASAGIVLAVSPASTVRAANDKLVTSSSLRARGVAAAETWLPADVPPDATFPLFVKPRFGRGGVGAHTVRNRAELEFFGQYVADPVVQPYLDGPEFTIDLFCDFGGRALSVVPRERIVVRAGVVDRGRTSKNPLLIDLALDCAAALRFHGAVNLQCRVVAGQPVIFEINPRFSGGIPLTIAAGADFPAMLVALARGREVPPSIGRFTDALWMTSFESSVFVRSEAIGFSGAVRRCPVPEVA